MKQVCIKCGAPATKWIIKKIVNENGETNLVAKFYCDKCAPSKAKNYPEVQDAD